MSDLPALSRRHLGLAAAGVAAVAAIPGVATAQPMSVRRELTEGDWMAQVKAQHDEIDAILRRIETGNPGERERAFQGLKVILSAHSFAEDAVIYPALASNEHRREAKHLYDEQDDAKILLGELDNTPLNSPVWMEKFKTLAGSVRAHVREEEDREFPALMRRTEPDLNRKLSGDFRRHFTKYAA